MLPPTDQSPTVEVAEPRLLDLEQKLKKANEMKLQLEAKLAIEQEEKEKLRREAHNFQMQLLAG